MSIGTAFAAWRKSSFEAELRAGRLSEEVTFQPAAGGPARTIWALCDWMKESSRFGPSIVSNEDLRVCVSRDEEAETIGGVATAHAGDQILRGDGNLFTFTGSVLEQTDYSQVLKFTRKKQTQAGTNQSWNR